MKISPKASYNLTLLGTKEFLALQEFSFISWLSIT